MADYKLTYFDFDGGRGEPVRLAFHIGGIEFEDHRISFKEFGAQRESFRFNALPTLEIDGVEITQANAMCRYVGRPPLATERLSELEDGRLLYELRHPWRDGTTHVAFALQWAHLDSIRSREATEDSAANLGPTWSARAQEESNDRLGAILVAWPQLDLAAVQLHDAQAEVEADAVADVVAAGAARFDEGLEQLLHAAGRDADAVVQNA